jgi:hypothetical protein
MLRHTPTPSSPVSRPMTLTPLTHGAIAATITLSGDLTRHRSADPRPPHDRWKRQRSHIAILQHSTKHSPPALSPSRRKWPQTRAAIQPHEGLATSVYSLLRSPLASAKVPPLGCNDWDTASFSDETLPILLALTSLTTTRYDRSLPMRGMCCTQRAAPSCAFRCPQSPIRASVPLPDRHTRAPHATRHTALAPKHGGRDHAQSPRESPTSNHREEHFTPSPQSLLWMTGSTCSIPTPTRSLDGLPPASGTNLAPHSYIYQASHLSDPRLSNTSHMEVGKAPLKYKSASTVFSNSSGWIFLS